LGIFSIRDIEAASGIKSHTLRIWEQRYGILKPKRTDTNIRYYDDDDLKYILNISILNKHGYKISEIAKLSKDEINEQIIKLNSRSTQYESQIKSLVSAMISYDEYTFHQIITTSVIQFGIEETMLNIVFPLLTEIGLLWQVGCIHPSHEHFASNIIKQKLYVAIDGNVGKFTKERKKFLLFLPEGEQHNIGLLFANYVLRSRGHDVLFLGQEVPMVDLARASIDIHPEYVFTTVTASTIHFNKQNFIDELKTVWPNAKYILSGYQFAHSESNDFLLPPNFSVIKNAADFISFVDDITASASQQDFKNN
jgi:DNA-binding transcriptional MerR regulator/methylmalonyl-CoA mutase cobalamin-binding subunit